VSIVNNVFRTTNNDGIKPDQASIFVSGGATLSNITISHNVDVVDDGATPRQSINIHLWRKAAAHTAPDALQLAQNQFHNDILVPISLVVDTTPLEPSAHVRWPVIRRSTTTTTTTTVDTGVVALFRVANAMPSLAVAQLPTTIDVFGVLPLRGLQPLRHSRVQSRLQIHTDIKPYLFVAMENCLLFQHFFLFRRLSIVIRKQNYLSIVEEPRRIGGNAASTSSKQACHIAMAGDSTQFLPMLAVINSTLTNSPNLRPMFHLLLEKGIEEWRICCVKFIANVILGDDQQSMTKQLDCLLSKQWRARVQIVPFAIDDANLFRFDIAHSDKSSLGRNLSSPHNFVRFYLPQLLPTSVEKVVWLDADVVVLQDICRLYDNALIDNHFVIL
jgi:hypothetical protein